MIALKSIEIAVNARILRTKAYTIICTPNKSKTRIMITIHTGHNESDASQTLLRRRPSAATTLIVIYAGHNESDASQTLLRRRHSAVTTIP
jgi:hypothetical protein